LHAPAKRERWHGDGPSITHQIRQHLNQTGRTRVEISKLAEVGVNEDNAVFRHAQMPKKSSQFSPANPPEEKAVVVPSPMGENSPDLGLSTLECRHAKSAATLAHGASQWQSS
jgi:hypothetical protein